MIGEMRTGAEVNNEEDTNVVEMHGGVIAIGPEKFDISGSPEKDPEEEIALAPRRATPSERRLRIPERTPVKKRRPDIDKDSPAKRFVMDPGDSMDSDDCEVGDGMVGGAEMQFDDEFMIG